MGCAVLAWITFYGGVCEVGGNKVLVEAGDAKLLLDFGVSFSRMEMFYSPPLLRPRREKSLVELGLLPSLEGVYRFDKSEAAVDAVIVSHVHMDHAGFLPVVKREIPVFCGETSAVMMDAFTSMKRWIVEGGVERKSVNVFRTGGKFRVGDVEVRPVHVDHSVPGSYGLMIHTPEGTVVYTGDFRMHGAKRKLTEDFVSVVEKEDVDVLITEATNISNAYVSSEEEVKAKLRYIVENTEGIVVAYFASTDIDRFRTFYEVAKENGRKLVVSTKQAYFLSKLKDDPHLEVPRLSDESIMIFRKKKESYKSWEREALSVGSAVDAGDISRMQGEVVLVASLYDFEELVEVEPVPGSCYVYSASEPFNEEMEMDFNKMRNWLDHYGLPQYHLHVSGHVMPIELKMVLERIKPKKVLPIHCEHPEVFAKFVKTVKTSVILPKEGERYPV